jgi:hypothetical protein
MEQARLEPIARAIVRKFIIDLDRLGQYEFEGRTIDEEVDLRWEWWCGVARAAVDAMMAEPNTAQRAAEPSAARPDG